MRPGWPGALLLGTIGLVIAALVGLWWLSHREAAPGPAAAMSDDELAERLARDPSTLLRSGEEWRDLPSPARAIWSTWRFGLMADGMIPWSVAEGMPTVAEMAEGFTVLGLPAAAALVAAYADDRGGEARIAAHRSAYGAMRRAIADAQHRYLRAHLAEIARTP